MAAALATRGARTLHEGRGAPFAPSGIAEDQAPLWARAEGREPRSLYGWVTSGGEVPATCLRLRSSYAAASAPQMMGTATTSPMR